MIRLQLENLIRACGVIADSDDIVVIGSQSILGQFPDAPAELLFSNEADVRGDHSEGSPFERSFGSFAHGIDETTAAHLQCLGADPRPTKHRPVEGWSSQTIAAQSGRSDRHQVAEIPVYGD